MASLVMLFLPIRNAEPEPERKETLPIGAKREGKPRYSGATLRAHAVVSPLNLSAEFSLLFFCVQKKSNETEMSGEVVRSTGGDKKFWK